MDLNLTCARCGHPHRVNTVHLRALELKHLPRHCPRCLDQVQDRPPEARVVERALLQEWDSVTVALPAEWWTAFRAGPDDQPVRRAIVKGALGRGASWNGRCDVYDTRPDGTGLGRVRLMRVTHERGVTRTERHGEPLGPKEQVEVSYPDTYKYLAIDPSTATEPTAALIWAAVGYKTTPKGLGRQWAASLDAVDALWACPMSSWARSDRFGSRMALALVDDVHVVWGTWTGDVQAQRVWSLSHPLGADPDLVGLSAQEVAT